MGRADAYFHAGFAGILVLGFVVVAPAADALWERLNRGVRPPKPKALNTTAASRGRPVAPGGCEGQRRTIGRALLLLLGQRACGPGRGGLAVAAVTEHASLELVRLSKPSCCAEAVQAPEAGERGRRQGAQLALLLLLIIPSMM